jgi:DNA-binding GntR family transcriptional regulator
MVAALSARDTAAMRTVMASHLANKLDTVLTQLRAAKAAAKA